MHDRTQQVRPLEPTRRDLLSLAAGLGISFALPGLDLRAASLRGVERPKSLIVLWLDGGPSQLETWDPHPGTRSGGDTRAIETSLPGARIAANYPRLAERLHLVNVVRSLVSKEGDHERGTYFLKTGYRPDPTLRHPTLGAVLARELPEAGVEIPRHVSIGNGQWPAWGGFLGAEYDAYKIFDAANQLDNMTPRVNDERQSRRLAGLDAATRAFERGRRKQLASANRRETVERALAMMRSEQLRAFRIDEEPAEVRSAYGETSFGLGCLTARRLVEEGVRTVEVTLSGWDSHANNAESHAENAAILDPALATLLHDLESRDLLAGTLVLCLGEFGRTPQINPLDGRDHWPHGFSCLIGGGGLRDGTVLGATDPTGQSQTPEDPIEIKDLFATVLAAVGVEHGKEIVTPIGRPMAYSAGQPIARLMTT